MAKGKKKGGLSTRRKKLNRYDWFDYLNTIGMIIL